MIEYKNCNCDDDFWEIIVVQKDESYDFKTVIYYHCDSCGEDFRVEDFHTGKKLQPNYSNDYLSKIDFSE